MKLGTAETVTTTADLSELKWQLRCKIVTAEVDVAAVGASRFSDFRIRRRWSLGRSGRMMVGSAAPAPGTGSSNNGGQILQPAISLRRALYPLVVQRQRHASGMA